MQDIRYICQKQYSKPIYLFILSPPYCGSTLLYKILHSSPNTSTLIGYNNWAGEGQWLYKRFQILDYEKNRWNPQYKLPIKLVKQCYDFYWNYQKKILVEKSPAIICRAKKYEQYFSQFGDVYFLVMMRNPYAWKPRNGKHDDWIKYAFYQKKNLENLKNTLYISYEELVINPQKIKKKILNFLPLLKHLNMKIQNIPGLSTERNQSLNQSHINRVFKVEEKNKFLIKHLDLLNYFNYKYLD